LLIHPAEQAAHVECHRQVDGKVTITYKILCNDAVAMTGGQPVDGRPAVPSIAGALVADGMRRVVVVTDEPEEMPEPGSAFHRVNVDLPIPDSDPACPPAARRDQPNGFSLELFRQLTPMPATDAKPPGPSNHRWRFSTFSGQLHPSQGSGGG
jgi:hypothetical protein